MFSVFSKIIVLKIEVAHDRHVSKNASVPDVNLDLVDLISQLQRTHYTTLLRHVHTIRGTQKYDSTPSEKTFFLFLCLLMRKKKVSRDETNGHDKRPRTGVNYSPVTFVERQKAFAIHRGSTFAGKLRVFICYSMVNNDTKVCQLGDF